jgi:hypothetical protein
MKKLIVLSAMALILAATGYSQTTEAMLKKDIKADRKEESAIKKEKRKERRELRKLDGTVVRYGTREQFAQDFGNIRDARWARSAYYDEATFTKDGQVWTAYYDYDSKLVGTTTHKTFGDIPLKAQNYINQKYGDYSKGVVVFFDDNEASPTDMIMYDQQFQDADNYFVELKKDNRKIVLQVTMEGDVTFFKQLK